MCQSVCVLYVHVCVCAGDSKPGKSVELEREIQGKEGAGSLLTYNSHLHLSVANQRQRLPIFQVYMHTYN